MTSHLNSLTSSIKTYIINLEQKKPFIFINNNHLIKITYRVQFSLYNIFKETVISQIFSTVLCLASVASFTVACDNETLSNRLCGGGRNSCLFVEASVRCCIVDAPPSIARKINEPR